MLSKPGTTWETRFFLAGVITEAKFEGNATEKSTMDSIWKILLWPFAWAFKGVWPRCDSEGVLFDETYRPDLAAKAGLPLCGGYRFALWQIAADLDYCCNYLRLRHFGSLSPCFKCACNRSDVPWTALTPTAAWRTRLVGMLEWTNMYRHMLFRCPAVGLNMFHVCLDVLHILDLGIAQHLCASTLFLFVFDTGIPGNLDSRLAFVWEKLVEGYEALGTSPGERLPYAVYHSIFEKRRGYYPTTPPELHSKAAVGRHCVTVLDYMVRHMTAWSQGFTNDGEGDLFAMVGELFKNYALFYACIAFHGQWLPPEAAQEAHDALLAVGCYHQALCNFFLGRRRKLYHMTEKAHYCQHIALDVLSSRYNPRFGWTYQDEDYMGKVASVAKSCTRARGPLRLGEAFVFRWRNRMHLLWSRKRRERGTA